MHIYSTINSYCKHIATNNYTINLPFEGIYRMILQTTESSKYNACIQTAVARGLGMPTRRLAGHHSDAASKHSLCYFS